MLALILCHIKFIFSKHIIIMSLLSFVIIFFLGIFQLLDISYVSTSERIQIYYSGVFPYCVMISTIYSVFLFGYLLLRENDDYRKVIITSKVKYYFSKIIVIYSYIFILTLVNELIIALIGFFLTKVVLTNIYTIFINILISAYFYSSIAICVVIAFNNFNLLYFVFIVFILSLSNHNTLKYVIVSFNDTKLSCSSGYYLFLCLFISALDAYLYYKKEI